MSARGQGLQGRKVLIKLIDGTKIVDIFKDNTSRHIILAEYGRVRRDQVKKMTPWIEPQYLWADASGKGRKIDNDQAKAFPNICPVQDWVPGTFVEGLGGTGAQYTTCLKVLSKDGVCPEHGKVRFSGFEKREDDDAKTPTLRKTPPRRAGGRTRPRRMCR